MFGIECKMYMAQINIAFVGNIIGLITVFDAILTSRQLMDFSEAMFYENYLTLGCHTNTVISRRVCLLVKMVSKTVIRPITFCSFKLTGLSLITAKQHL